MKIKFKNGYTVEVTDCEGMSRGQIYKEAYDAMIATKRMNDSKKVKDSHPEINYKSNMLSHISKLKSAIDKKTGEVTDPKTLDYEIKNIEIDMDADLNHDTWYKKYHPEALEGIVNDYKKYIDVIKYANDEKYINKANELENKLEEIKKVFKLSEEVEDAKDIKIEDVPVAEPTASYSLNFDPYVSTDNIDKANSYLTSRDRQQKAAAVEILKNEFPALRENLENDIDQAEDFIETFNKDQLRIFMQTYENIINVYAAANMLAEAKTLKDLYNDLYYNALHLGRMAGKSIEGSKSVIARKRL